MRVYRPGNVSQKLAVDLSLQKGRELVDMHKGGSEVTACVVADYRGDATLGELAERYQPLLSTIKGDTPRVAERALRFFLSKALTVEERREIAARHRRANMARTEEARVRSGNITRWTPEEDAGVLALCEDPEYRSPTQNGPGYRGIAAAINTAFHNGRDVRNPETVRRRYYVLRKEC